jgi:hypothetical protein
MAKTVKNIQNIQLNFEPQKIILRWRIGSPYFNILESMLDGIIDGPKIKPCGSLPLLPRE